MPLTSTHCAQQRSTSWNCDFHPLTFCGTGLLWRPVSTRPVYWRTQVWHQNQEGEQGAQKWQWLRFAKSNCKLNHTDLDFVPGFVQNWFYHNLVYGKTCTTSFVDRSAGFIPYDLSFVYRSRPLKLVSHGTVVHPASPHASPLGRLLASSTLSGLTRWPSCRPALGSKEWCIL